MKKIYFILLLIFINISTLLAQQHDNTWIVGYNGANKADYPNFGTTFMYFEDTLRLEPKFIQMDYSKTNSTISDRHGKFLFTTNKARIMGNDGKYVNNGDTLLIKKKSDYDYGFNDKQGIILLPIPSDSNRYFLLYTKDSIYHSSPLYYSIYDKRIGLNGGILKKNTILSTKKLGIGKITACKHGNGRDWWVRIPGKDASHYKYLLTPDGISLKEQQNIGYKLEEGLGQAVFSPNGKRFVETNAFDNKIGMDINIYDFDRCSGLMSNYKRIHFDTASFVGCAISPNSRFLYFSNGYKVLQYDLNASDIKTSETLIAVWDGFIDFAMTGFELMQLAPNGKIYIATNGATHYLHTIEKPDEKGLACQVKQRSVKLFNYNARSIPNHPNYRLGALKGSPCDTLQGGVGTKEMESKTFEVEIYPNPANDYVTFSWAKPVENITISITDMLGKTVFSTNTNTNDTYLTVDSSTFSSGMYQVSINSVDNKLSHIAKIIINH